MFPLKYKEGGTVIQEIISSTTTTVRQKFDFILVQ